MTKPSTAGTKFQICFIGSPSYACTDQSPTYTQPGLVKWASRFSNFYQYDQVDWSKPISTISLILKDTMNGKPSADNVGPATAALYMPTEVRMVITLVEPGSVYEPPAPVGESTLISCSDHVLGRDPALA